MIAPALLALTLIAADGDPVSTSTTVAIASPDDKRELPDYDGREPVPSDIGDGLLWVPRVVLFPMWLVSEFVVRRPLGWLITTAERNQWPTLVLDFFTFGEERTAGIFPTALVDFGFRPSVGIYAFWDKLIVEQNSARIYAAYGGSDWYSVRVSDRIQLRDDGTRLAFTVDFTHRPDYRFEGIGPRVEDLLARYRSDQLEGTIAYDSPIGDAGHFSAFAGAHRVRFRLGEGGCCGNRALEDVVAAGEIQAPPGFGEDYAVYEHGARIEVDTRRARPSSGSGLRLEMYGAQSFPLSASLETPWIDVGGAVGGFLDLTGHNRVLSLFISSEFVEAIDHVGEVPFTELVTVGGASAMPGFRPGTLLGQSRINGQLEYRWPIWAFLDGTLHFGMGNVFGERLEDFRWDLLRMSFGLGMRTVGRRDHAFNFLVAAGTETFADGADITTFRFTIGTTRGF
jgi:hypothetical protein